MKRVAIIGAGITGLYLAQKLSQRGYKIFLFEKKECVGNKLCSGLYSERIFDFIPEAKNFIQNKIDFVFINFPKKTIKVSFKKELFVINRNLLDKFLFLKINKEKVKIHFNYNFQKIPRKFYRIIGTDGANSTVRKLLKLKEPRFYFTKVGYLEKKDFSNFVEVFPHKKGGFLWKIPRGEQIEFGILGDRKETLTVNKIFEKFLKKNKIKLTRVKGGLIAEGFILPKKKNITLCGEATGIVKSWSGGGVIWSLKSANILLDTFPDFLEYRKRMKRFFLKKIYFSKIVKKLVYFLGFNFSFFLPNKVKIENDFLI